MGAGLDAEPAAPARKRRLFYALWPDAAARRALEHATRAVRRQCGPRYTVGENLHLTLAFLGALGVEQWSRALALEAPAVPPFELRLDRLGYWPRSRILWLAPHEPPAALTALERALWEGLRRLGFEREPRPFLPHVTLCRGARAVSAAVRPVGWRVERFALVESLPMAAGTRYVPRAFWPLAAHARLSPGGPEKGGCDRDHSME